MAPTNKKCVAPKHYAQKRITPIATTQIPTNYKRMPKKSMRFYQKIKSTSAVYLWNLCGN